MPAAPPTGLSPPPIANLLTGPMPSAKTTPEAAGKAFEGMFASMLVKQMRQSLGGSTLFGSDKSDALGGLFDQFMGHHMASHGGLGIGNMIRRQMELRSATNAQPQPQRVPAAYTRAAQAVHRPPSPRS
jgi:peptidoglycan hydrolase FlgJ